MRCIQVGQRHWSGLFTNDFDEALLNRVAGDNQDYCPLLVVALSCDHRRRIPSPEVRTSHMPRSVCRRS